MFSDVHPVKYFDNQPSPNQRNQFVVEKNL